MTQHWRRGFGILLFALLLLNFAASLHLLVQRANEGNAGLRVNSRGKKFFINGVELGSPAAGVFQVGDELVAVNGVSLQDNISVLANDHSPPGTRYTMTVRRAGQLLEVPLTTVPQSDPYPWERVAGRLTDLLFLAIGIFVFFFRAADKQAQVLGLMLGTFTAISVGDAPAWPHWAVQLIFLAQFFGLWFLPLGCHLFLIFPESSPLLRRWSRLERWLYLPLFLFVLPNFGLSRLLRPPLGPWAERLQTVLPGWYKVLTGATLIVYLAGAVLLIAVNYRAASPAARRKLRVVLAGCGAGFLSFLLIVAQELFGLGQGYEQLLEVLGLISRFTIPLIPLTFAYAIIRHQVIPLGLILQRGARYVLVSQGSNLLVLTGVGALLWLVMDALFRYLHWNNGRVVGTLSALVAIAVWHYGNAFHQHVIAPRIDRRFFRQAYDAQQVMTELGEALRTATSLPQVLELLATRVQSAVQAETVTIFLREGGEYRAAYHCEYSHHNRKLFPRECPHRLKADAAVITRLSTTREPLDLDGRDPQFSLNDASSIFSGDEREVVDSLRPLLLIPILGKEDLFGVIALGRHLGDLPYSTEDKRLLLSVGAPTTFALENARLIERMLTDERRRQELEAENEARARELEGARQLQLSMLPKQVPQLPGLDIAAYMKTATEVGGDYYDFDLAPDGTLTIAVGDATGHGLKAGTVVTATKSLFRTFAREPEPAAMLKQSARVLKEMNLRALFMALTLVKLNGQRLKISTAGMPAVLLYRAGSQTVEEISIRAMPLGSVAAYPYRQVELDIGGGDVLLVMSDGFPERFNGRNEMLGYDQAARVLRETAARRADEIVARFVAVGDEWADGRAQDDDVTFVVLKVNEKERQ